MRLPLEKIWPAGHRWFQVLHLDHMLQVKSRLRAMLLVSCAISLSYSVAWLVDVLQMSCFNMTPWKLEGLGCWTCLVYLVGGVALAFMFQHSATALAYYDEDGQQLRNQKERFLAEMQTQTGGALHRATNQAQRLCGMLSADLGDKVNEHVFRMRRILGQLSRESGPGAEQLYVRLVTQMSYHLHHLRQPAIAHFEKLIKLSGQTWSLREALRNERRESMVELLAGPSSGVPRTETMQEEMEDGLLQMLDDLAGTDSRFQKAMCCCCTPHSSMKKEAGLLADVDGTQMHPVGRTSSVDRTFNMPSDLDLQDELAPVSLEQRKTDPEKVVLQPLRLVLRWLEKLEPRSEPTSRSPGPAGLKLEAALEVKREVMEQISIVKRHLQHSPFYRCILLGICCSVALFFWYAEMLHVCWTVLVEGRCHAQLVVPCVAAVVRKLFGMAAMGCYAVSLGVVLWNVERLDAVLEVQKDIHEIEDFKRQIDQLNAHDLADEDQGASLIQTVEKALSEQKSLVNDFFNSGWGGSMTLASYEQLADDLEAARFPDAKAARPLFGSDASQKANVADKAYKRLPEAHPVTHPSYGLGGA